MEITGKTQRLYSISLGLTVEELDRIITILSDVTGDSAIPFKDYIEPYQGTLIELVDKLKKVRENGWIYGDAS